MTFEEDGVGGGAGGATGMDDGNNLQSANGTYQVAGNRVVLLARPDPAAAEPAPSNITLLSAGSIPTFANDGKVDIRGAKGVRITSGPPGVLLPGSPPVTSSDTDGIEVLASQSQTVTIGREEPFGLAGEYIQISKGSITINAGLTGKITLMAGANSITIDALGGVTIVGLPYVQINPIGPPPPPPVPFQDELALPPNLA